MHRRELLRLGAGAAALAIARRAGADQIAPEPPKVRVRAGVVSGGTISLQADLAAHAPHLFSIANENDRFTAWLMILPPTKDTWPYLTYDDQVVKATSVGRDRDVTTATFELDTRQAVKLAGLLGITLAERVPLDGGLTYAWSAPGRAAKGQPARIALRIGNGGHATVRIAGSAGPRDSRFRLALRRDGHDVPTHEPNAIDEASQILRLAPGDHVDLEVDLRMWIDEPGVYDVDARFVGAIFPDTTDAGRWPDHAAETWDVFARGAMRVIVA